MSAGNIISNSFVKTKLSPLRPHSTTSTGVCAASLQVSSGDKNDEINKISCCTFAPIEVQVTSTDDPMVVLYSKGRQKLSRNIVLQAAAYDAVRKGTVIPIQEMNK